MKELLAPAKLNLALVVGPRRPDGRHQVATVLQRMSLADRIGLEPAGELRIEGFNEDTLVRQALEALADHVRKGRVRQLAVERFDGEPIVGSPIEEVLIELGFRQGPRKLTLTG